MPLTFPALGRFLMMLTWAFVLMASSHSSALAQTVTTKPAWKADQAFTFVLNKAQERSNDGQKIVKNSSRIEFTLKVNEASATGYLLELVYGETTIQSAEGAPSAFVQRLNDLNKGISIILNVDANGNFKGVRNWQDVKKAYAATLQEISAEPPGPGMTQEEVSKYLSNVSTSVSTKPQIEAVATQDVQLFFMCLGHSYEVGKPIVYKSKVPNPIPGGRELPSLSSFELVSTDASSGIATIHFKQSLVDEEARRILDDTIRTLERKAGKPLPESQALKDMKISDAAAFKVEIDSGWIKSAKHGRVVRAGEGYQKETSSIERK